MASRRPSGLRKTIGLCNSLAHRTTWLRSDFSVTARSPAGMHDLSMALLGRSVASIAPRKGYYPLRFNAQDGGPFPCNETGVSKRLFTPHERFSVSGTPLADHSSQPASSTPGKICCRSVRFRAPLLVPFPEPGRFTAFTRYLRSDLAVSTLPQVLFPFRTAVLPDHHSPRFRAEKLILQNVRSPYTPRKLF